MKALDTNVIVRFLVADDAGQAGRVRKLFQDAEDRRETLFVSLVVMLETIWVLGAVYGISRAAILDAAEKLTGLPFLRFEFAERINRWISAGRQSNLDLADLIIGLTARDNGCSVTVTLDRKSVRSELFELL